MKDFWLSCGHHLLDRDEGGGLVVTDEFLKVYLARPELDAAAGSLRGREDPACRADGRSAPRRRDRRDRRDRGRGCARELAGDDRVSRSSDAPPDAGGGLSRHRAHRRESPAHLPQSARARDPAQRARRLRGPVRAARRRTVLPHPAHDPARRLADRRRRGNDRRHVGHAGLAAGLDARHSGGSRDRHHVGRQCRALFRAQRSVSRRARS